MTVRNCDWLEFFNSLLDVQTVEQIAAKFSDMPTISQRSLVSVSSFTDAAVRKADAWGLELLQLERSEAPLKTYFPKHTLVGPASRALHSLVSDLRWERINSAKFNPEFSDRASLVECLQGNPPLFNSAGDRHPFVPDRQSLDQMMCTQSIQSLQGDEGFQLHPTTLPLPLIDGWEGKEVGIDFPTHFAVELPPGIFLNVKGAMIELVRCELDGVIRRQYRKAPFDFHVLKYEGSDKIAAGAAISAVAPEQGLLMAVLFSPVDSGVQTRFLQLGKTQLNVIRRLRIK